VVTLTFVTHASCGSKNQSCECAPFYLKNSRRVKALFVIFHTTTNNNNDNNYYYYYYYYYYYPYANFFKVYIPIRSCEMLGVVGSSLKMVRFEPTSSNISQHIATRWPNARNMLPLTMLRYVVLACLAGVKCFEEWVDSRRYQYLLFNKL